MIKKQMWLGGEFFIWVIKPMQALDLRDIYHFTKSFLLYFVYIFVRDSPVTLFV